MRKLFLLLCTAAASFSALVPANAQSTQEERTVRNTYAKLAFATMIERVHDLLIKTGNPSAAEIEASIAAHELTFVLSDFSAGSISEIAKRPYADLVTRPDGQDVVYVVPINFKNTEDLRDQLQVRQTEELGAEVSWTHGQNANSENWQVPFNEALPLVNSQNNSSYSRYASYKVTVSLDGRSRSYKAMFLFGTGQVPVLVADNVTNGPALGQFVSASVYPAILLDSATAQKTGIVDWLRLHRLSEADCPSGRREVCCDSATLRCGVSGADADAAPRKAALSSPSPGPFSERGRSLRRNARLVNVSTSSFRSRPITHCYSLNFTANGATSSKHGTEQHTTEAHFWNSAPYGNCSYNDPNYGSICLANAFASQHAGVYTSESGNVTGFCHVIVGNYVNGSATGTTPSASTNAAAAVVTCALCACSPSISFANYAPTFPSGNIWNVQNPYTITCPEKHEGTTPIIIDTTGRGFHLTSRENGVLFDIAGDGHPVQVSWTDAAAGNAFLALDRNGDGVIDSGKELFGSKTDQPKSDDPNGFLALAVFDKPENGGNGDGIIDEHDKIWPQLRLWIDENHDGISQPNELHTLPELGVYSIDLKYAYSRHYDQFGNLFRYKGDLNPGGEPAKDKVDRLVYDVILVTTD